MRLARPGSVLTVLCLLLSVWTLAGCTRIVLESEQDQPLSEVRSDLTQIGRIATQFNANSSGITEAESEEQMVKAFQRNRQILDALQAVQTSLTSHLNANLREFPSTASGGRPAQSTLAAFRDALGDWLTHQLKTQKVAETCMEIGSNLVDCVARESIQFIPDEYRLHDAFQKAWSALRLEMVGSQ